MTTRLAVDGFDYSAPRDAGLALLTATLHEDTSAREELARDLGETDAALQDLAAFMASRDGDAS